MKVNAHPKTHYLYNVKFRTYENPLLIYKRDVLHTVTDLILTQSLKSLEHIPPSERDAHPSAEPAWLITYTNNG